MALPKLFTGILSKSADKRRVDAYREAIQEEAKVGGRVFGEIPKGTRREFFCLDEHTWVWHEEWDDEKGVHHVRTTRYDIRPHGVFKAQDGQPYKPLQKEEAKRLLLAMRRYNELIDQELAPFLSGR